MKRRTFLHGTGAALCAGLLGTKNLSAVEKSNPVGGLRIDAGRLLNRNQNRSTMACTHGVVCASQPLAAQAGVDVLKSGGNAIDAAIAANAMLSLVEPMNCGPGGDLFAIVWDEKSQKLHGLNASGRSPYAWGLQDALNLGLKDIPPYSPLAWSVPGCVSGWQALHERFGKLKLEAIFGPVIRYAREGFPVSPIIAGDWPFESTKFPSLAETFMPGGKAPIFGEIFSNPDLAVFYESLLRDGLASFYRGDIAERMVKFSEANGGRFSRRDFEEHTADWVDPVSTNYRGYDVFELPPNGQGISALQILNMIGTFDIGTLVPNSAEQLHLFIEAKKLAYEDRAVYYADRDKADVPVDWLISKAYGLERAKKIDPRRAAVQVAPGQFAPKSETIYLTAADGEGNMVSLIQSTYHGWGSHYVPDHLGFALQNRGELFALDAKHRNKLEPHKRPFHTIIPAFVLKDRQPVFSFGVMGGDFQPQGHAQVLMNWIDYGMSPQQAGEQPRIAHNGSSTPTGHTMERGGRVGCEPLIPESTRAALAAMGHEVSKGDDVFGGYQAIARLDGPLRYFGGSDPRKDGAAIGY